MAPGGSFVKDHRAEHNSIKQHQPKSAFCMPQKRLCLLSSIGTPAPEPPQAHHVPAAAGRVAPCHRRSAGLPHGRPGHALSNAHNRDAGTARPQPPIRLTGRGERCRGHSALACASGGGAARAGRRAHGPDAANALVGLLARVQQRVLRGRAAAASLHEQEKWPWGVIPSNMCKDGCTQKTVCLSGW